MRQKSRTAKLLLAYMEYIEVVTMFTRVECRGDWIQHLHATERTLNFLTMIVLVHCGKSTWLYLRLMYCLNEAYINNSLESAITWLEGQENHCQRFGVIW